MAIRPGSSPSAKRTSAAAPDEHAFCSISQAAALLGVSRVTIWRWVRAGHLPVWRLGHRIARIKREDLDRFLASNGPATTWPRPLGTAKAPATERPDDAPDGARRLDRSRLNADDHGVQFYESDEYLLDAVGAYVGAALEAGDAAIVIATAAHREATEARLRARGLDLAAAASAGRYFALDAAETIDRLLVDGLPHQDRFARVIGGLVARAAAGGRRVRIFGEMVALLVGEGNSAATVHLEALWNELRASRPFGLLCGYPMASFDGEALAEVLGEVCAEHTSVVPTESYTALATESDQLRAVAALQQQARSLEAEIARRQQVEEQLRAALAAERRREQELRDFVETAPLAMHWLAADGTVLWANAAEMALLGYTPEEFIGHHIAEFHLDRETIDDLLTRLGRGEILHEHPARLRCKDGTIKRVVIDSSAHWEDGRFIHTRCFTRDVTNLELLGESRGQLAAIVESADDAIIGKSLDGIIMSWNPGAERLYGYTAAEVVGKPISILIPPDRPDELPSIMERLRRGVRIDHYETERMRKDGRRVDISVSISPVRDAHGAIVSASAIARDITERKRQEAALRDERETLETLNRLGQTIAAELDLDVLVQAITDTATELSGAQFGALFYNRVDPRGEAYQLYALSGASREAFERFPMPRNTELFDATFRGEGPVRLDDVRQDPRFGRNAPYHGMPNGHLPVVSYLAVPVVSRSGTVLGGLFLGHAEPAVFTERVERLVQGLAAMSAVAMDNALLYRQVQEAVRTRDGFLAAAAHDLKTPLTAVKGMSQLLRRQLARAGMQGSERLIAGLGSIDATATKMSEQIDELLDLTRLRMGEPLELRRRSTDMVALVRRIVAEQQQVTERHTLAVETDLPELCGTWDTVRLARVLDNLLGNAVKYSPDGGTITVSVGQETADDGGRWAVLAVRDEGMGIPSADLTRIFERFQRAGNVGGQISGTGIGLASARQIVEQHGGTITVESQLDEGSIFTVRLPIEPPDEAPAS